MKNEIVKVWVFKDNQDRVVGTMHTEQLRQVLGIALPETLPQKLPMLFPSAEVAKAYTRHNWKFRGLRTMQVDFDESLRAFVMIQAVTEEGCWNVVYYKGEEDEGKGWESMPLSMPGGSSKTGISLN